RRRRGARGMATALAGNAAAAVGGTHRGAPRPESRSGGTSRAPATGRCGHTTRTSAFVRLGGSGSDGARNRRTSRAGAWVAVSGVGADAQAREHVASGRRNRGNGARGSGLLARDG